MCSYIDQPSENGTRHSGYTMTSKTVNYQVMMNRLDKIVLPCISIGILFLIWYLGTKYKINFYIRFGNVPTPYEVWQQILQVASSNDYLINIYESMKRIMFGFFIALVLGVLMGILIGKYKLIHGLCMPAIEVLRPIPAIAWVPISIMLWPSSESSIVFITFLGAFFPILINTVHGVNTLDGVLIRAAKSLGASEVNLFLYVLLPGVLPSVFTGLEVGMGVAWVSLIAAEMISGQFGVGYFTWESYSLVNYPSIVLGMLTIGVLGLICSSAIRLIGRLMVPWLAYSNGGKHDGR
ncbi:ABC transporter permease [Martelella alba]|uniref:ABC transporter permease n=2 Tax=Martelella alba TaxID=2590451 RepID=A0ABY2SNU6_9HYPH|nr:ABC transporter permease [Martelella alba]